MKRVACILLALSISLFSGCIAKPQAARPAPKQIKIGMTLYRQDDTFISLLQQSFESLAKARETQEQIKIVVNVADAKGNQGVQNEQVDQFLAQNYDVLCVNGVDRTAASVIIDKAKSANIPVIFFNREPVPEDVQRWDKVYYVGSMASTIGTMQGQLILNAYQKDSETVDRNADERLQYVMLEGEAGHQDSLIRTEYSVKALTNAGVAVEKLANDTANWQRAQASAKMSGWIEQFGNEIEVVFCNNDDMALGAIDAYESADISDLPLIVGTDATPAALEAVRAGKLTGTVLNDYQTQAQAMLDLACALATGTDPMQAVPKLRAQHFWAAPQTFSLKELEPAAYAAQEQALAARQQREETSSQESDSTASPSDSMPDGHLRLQKSEFMGGGFIVDLQPYFRNESAHPVWVSFKRVVSLQTEQTVQTAASEPPPLEVAAGEEAALPVVLLGGLAEGEYALEIRVKESEEISKLLRCPFSIRKPVDTALASSDTIQVELTLLAGQTTGLTNFQQTLENTSSQMIGLDRGYTVEMLQNDHWKIVPYPAGKEPIWTDDYLFLSPGDRVVLQGTLPFHAAKADPQARYRIVRHVTVQQPLPDQTAQIDLYSHWKLPNETEAIN